MCVCSIQIYDEENWQYYHFLMRYFNISSKSGNIANKRKLHPSLLFLVFNSYLLIRIMFLHLADSLSAQGWAIAIPVFTRWASTPYLFLFVAHKFGHLLFGLPAVL